MDAAQQRAVLTLCLMAAFADGASDDGERAKIKAIADSLGAPGSVDVAAIYQEVLLNKPQLPAVVTPLSAPEQKQFAYEMAVGVCNADGVMSDAERAFLAGLAQALGLPPHRRSNSRSTRTLLPPRRCRLRRWTARLCPQFPRGTPSSTSRSSTIRS